MQSNLLTPGYRLFQMGDFYHRMADYSKAGSSLNEAHEMSITYCPTDLVSALAAFHLGECSYSKKLNFVQALSSFYLLFNHLLFNQLV